MVDTFFDKMGSIEAATLANKPAIKNENMSSKELAEEHRKPIIRKCKKNYTQFL